MRLAAAAGAGSVLAGPLAHELFAAETAEYDDGSAAIPGGLAGDPDRVIIVGAGWAGLTLANALRNAGVEHVVLEGRGRIGGRAHTVDVGGRADRPRLLVDPRAGAATRWRSFAEQSGRRPPQRGHRARRRDDPRASTRSPTAS